MGWCTYFNVQKQLDCNIQKELDCGKNGSLWKRGFVSLHHQLMKDS